MKRAYASAINTDSSTPQLVNRGHRRSGSKEALQVPAKRGKATKQLSLHQFLNPVPTPRTKETPTLLGPPHKSNASSRRQSPEEGGGGPEKPQDEYPSAQRALERLEITLETPQMDACPSLTEPRTTTGSPMLEGALSRPSSADSCADDFKLFCSQTYERQSPQQPEDVSMSRTDSADDEEQHLSWSGFAGGVDQATRFPTEDVQTLSTQHAQPNALAPSFANFSFLGDLEDQPTTQPADDPIHLEDETCSFAAIQPNQAGANHAATPELVPTQVNASCSTAEVALGDNTHGTAHVDAPLFNIFRPAKDRKCLLIVRHGESEYNRACSESKGYADPQIFDPHLTTRGHNQCLDLKRRLQQIISEKAPKFGDPLFVVSPLTRTLQTFLEANPFPERLACNNQGSHDPACRPLKVEVLPAISEFMVTPGDVGRPPAHLVQEFPQLAKQLMQLPEVWWYQDPQQPNSALHQCWGSSEPQKSREHRISEFSRWLNGRREQLVVLVGHSSFWHHFTNKSRQRLQNGEVMSMTW
ncbi:hypothetical protein DUNSADRAFT_9578 [Dunaliella salina]|uniref:Phosphoglycerate mutase family protein n=1 Tax=Dunaliella salina TaxID=3046 RepID=A0ABQ7GH47_DUNSA|nr:hypothetical protein DUNSADRAFT_9578 [Dunaliella salina]|eukprot:KAF5833918.1 hypothetical protein DUNSADRAFT_9578 [Dunaliella salina]